MLREVPAQKETQPDGEQESQRVHSRLFAGNISHMKRKGLTWSMDMYFWQAIILNWRVERDRTNLSQNTAPKGALEKRHPKLERRRKKAPETPKEKRGFAEVARLIPIWESRSQWHLLKDNDVLLMEVSEAKIIEGNLYLGPDVTFTR